MHEPLCLRTYLPIYLSIRMCMRECQEESAKAERRLLCCNRIHCFCRAESCLLEPLTAVVTDKQHWQSVETRVDQCLVA